MRKLIILPALACVVALGACTNFRQQSFDIFGDEAPKASSKSVDASATMLRLAERAYESGEYGIAAQLYFQIAQQQPEKPEVMVKLGFALMKAGSAADSEKVLRALLDKEPKNSSALRGLGHSLVLQKRPVEALSAYRQAIAVSAKPEAQNYAGLGAALDLVGKHQEARAAYAAGLRLAPDDIGLRNNLAISYALTGDTARAKDILAGLPQLPDTRPLINERTVRPEANDSGSAPRKPVHKRRATAAPQPTAAAPEPKRVVEPALEREIVEVQAPASAPRMSRKISADLPMANADNNVVFIRTGRASSTRGEARHRYAMSFQSTANTPEEAAAEVLVLLEQAVRGPHFVWQQAQRPAR